jgi:hypothetical protein
MIRVDARAASVDVVRYKALAADVPVRYVTSVTYA